MKELIDKISSYNLFNNLLPGILFVIIIEKITTYSLIQENIIIGVFLYYFIGLIISRFGSLVVEPLLKLIRFLKFTKYEDYISAEHKDPKIKVLLEANNMYRAIISLIILLLLSKLYEYIESMIPIIKNYNVYFLIVLILIIFLCSYRKQTNYIRRRVNKGRNR